MMEFKLSEKENELAKKFLQEHRHPEVYKGAIGGHINFIFTPTSIGNAISIRCTICDTEENITDYNNW
jgi:cupin superfamily acireductone dioxygenase involved in methionine salvage